MQTCRVRSLEAALTSQQATMAVPQAQLALGQPDAATLARKESHIEKLRIQVCGLVVENRSLRNHCSQNQAGKKKDWHMRHLSQSVAAGNAVADPSADAEATTLDAIKRGGKASIIKITGGGNIRRRLLDMGLVPGAEVRVMRIASLGDPVEYGIKGTAIAMRRTDADSVLVEEVRDG